MPPGISVSGVEFERWRHVLLRWWRQRQGESRPPTSVNSTPMVREDIQKGRMVRLDMAETKSGCNLPNRFPAGSGGFVGLAAQ